MKTFRDLQEGDIIFRYDKDGDGIVAGRVLEITERKLTIQIEYVNVLTEGIETVFIPKRECNSEYNILNLIFFSCKNAVEEYLLQMERDERERHRDEEKKIQKLREQYESERS